MTRRHTTRFTVEFGDCDPAKIVHYPNFFKWIDAASRHFLSRRRSVVDRARSQDRYHRHAARRRVGALSASGDLRNEIAIESWIDVWRGKSFVMKHVIRRGDDVLVEGQETRIFARRHPDDPKRIQAVETPEAIKRMVA
jgi:4-hydroxybenzoyl-CoA thioesterase